MTIIAVLRDVLLREDKVRELFRGLHRAYTDAIANPFAPVPPASGGGERLSSPAFEEAVTRLVDAAHGQIEYRGPVPL